MYSAILLICAGLVRMSYATYFLKDNYDAGNWVNMFSFDTGDDPTHGYVNYVDRQTAQNHGLFKTHNNVVTFGSDATSVASGRGRNSVRLTSKNQYTHGLVVVDIAHMPGNACGIWPAFWMVGPDWPRGGEIDIIEGVNLQWGNKATMHTNDGCSFDGTSCFSTANTGCGKPAGEFNAYGNGFNVNGGGVYAVEWTSDRISIWFFGRGSVPRDVLGHAPDPSRWGSPTANFAGGHGCNIDSHFRNHKIVFDTTFCGTVLVVDREVQSPFTYSKAGDWAGNVFSQDPSCAATGQSCQNYVRNNPGAFSEAYWTINALKVYSNDGSGPRVLSRENAPSTSALSIPNSGGSAFANTSIPVSSPPTATGSTYLRNTFTDLTSSAPPAEQAGSERESSTSPITTSSGSPTTPGTTTAVSYMTDGVVIETVPTAIVYHTLPPGEHASGNRYGFPDESADSNDGSPSTDDSSPGPQPTSNMKRAHRAARHLKRHIAAAKK